MEGSIFFTTVQQLTSLIGPPIPGEEARWSVPIYGGLRPPVRLSVAPGDEHGVKVWIFGSTPSDAGIRLVRVKTHADLEVLVLWLLETTGVTQAPPDSPPQ